MIGIQVSRISADGKELVEIGGFMWRSDDETRAQFEEQRAYAIPFTPDAICLDLITEDEILDTITITQKRYAQLTGTFPKNGAS